VADGTVAEPVSDNAVKSTETAGETGKEKEKGIEKQKEKKGSESIEDESWRTEKIDEESTAVTATKFKTTNQLTKKEKEKEDMPANIEATRSNNEGTRTTEDRGFFEVLKQGGRRYFESNPCALVQSGSTK